VPDRTALLQHAQQRPKGVCTVLENLFILRCSHAHRRQNALHRRRASQRPPTPSPARNRNDDVVFKSLCIYPYVPNHCISLVPERCSVAQCRATQRARYLALITTPFASDWIAQTFVITAIFIVSDIIRHRSSRRCRSSLAVCCCSSGFLSNRFRCCAQNSSPIEQPRVL
jgi:hypothetical protein